MILALWSAYDEQQTAGQVVQLRFDITRPSGAPVDSVQVGESFDLDVFVQDIRPDAVPFRGVFSAFLDVFYETEFVSPSGQITFGDEYRLIPNPVIQSVPGAIENVGNTQTDLGLGGPAGADEFLLLRVPFTADVATTSGPTQLWGGPADNPPHSDVQVFTDPNNAVPLEEIVYGNDLLTITPLPLPGCDFNSDQACDLADINQMFAQGNLFTGVATSAATESFDLVEDNVINGLDIDAWLAQSASEHGYASPYRRGDTNQMGSISPETRFVDIADFNRLAIAFDPIGDGDPTNGPFWHQGNFDGDDDIDIGDFNNLAVNFAPLGYGTTSIVPEPSAGVLCLAGLLAALCAGCWRQRSRR